MFGDFIGLSQNRSSQDNQSLRLVYLINLH